MEMFYNSDQYVVVRFEVPALDAAPAVMARTPTPTGPAATVAPEAQATPGAADPTASGFSASVRGGYEIVDKHNRKEIFLEGLLAEAFHAGVQALVAQGPTEEVLDEYIGRYTTLAQQPVLLH